MPPARHPQTFQHAECSVTSSTPNVQAGQSPRLPGALPLQAQQTRKTGCVLSSSGATCPPCIPDHHPICTTVLQPLLARARTVDTTATSTPPPPPSVPKADKSSCQHPRCGGHYGCAMAAYTQKAKQYQSASVSKRVCIERLRNRQVNMRGEGRPVCLGPYCVTRAWVALHVRGRCPVNTNVTTKRSWVGCCLSTQRRVPAESGLQVSQYVCTIPGNCIAAAAR